jgi:Histidine kinase-, DNA gyrase B-, and HSP90-like ATPase
MKQGILFDARFLDRHAGALITDTALAVVELVANTWDAYASEVRIRWPNRNSDTRFSIVDNGKGMTADMFDRSWRKLDYNRLTEEGDQADPPMELKDFGPRRTYGRNGRGRHAAFRFSDPYIVRTWRDGTELTYEVRRGTTTPFDITLVNTRNGIEGHGTEISATTSHGVNMPAEEARQVIGTRFLADPNFKVSVDGTRVTFDDIPAHRLKEMDVDAPPFGKTRLIMVDTLKADRTTRQHGIAWRVNSRLVGTPGWVGFNDERILDGRTTEAKRFQFIVEADFLVL